MRLLLCIGIACLAPGLLACPARQNVQCSESSHCDLAPGGMCIAAANEHDWCAYPDPSCPGGYRYSDIDVGDGLSGVCAPNNLPVRSWVKHISADGYESVGGVALANDGSVFITGTFDLAIDLGGGPLMAAGTDLFIAKFTPDGRHVWSKRYGNASAQAGGTKLAILSNGDLAIAGHFRGSLTLGATTLNAVGNQDVFLARFSSQGDPIWARSGGTGNNDEVEDLSVDTNDNLAICGSFTGSGSFFGSPTLSGATTWLVRTTGAGDHSWSRAMAAGNTTTCGVTSMSDGDIVFVGNFNGTMNAGGDIFTSTGGSTDIYLVRYAATNGAHRWSVAKGGSGNDIAFDVEATGASIVVTGSFIGSASFGGPSLLGRGIEDAFAAKFDASNGSHQFSVAMGGSEKDSGERIAVRADGQVTVSGVFSGTASFGGMSLTAAGTNRSDPFVVDLDGTSGSVLSVRTVAGANVNDMATSAESLVLGGSFDMPITVLDQQLISTGLADGYVVLFKR